MELVSAIIPAHNRPSMLKEAIESALAQSYEGIEVLVVLNGATPETVEMAGRFRSNSKIRVVEMEDSTLGAARNLGIELARGEWVAFLDDDDLWLPTKLEVQLAAAAKQGADLVTCNFSIFNELGEIPHPGLSPLPAGLTFAEALMLGNYVSGGSAAIVKAAAIRSLGGFDARLRAGEDWDMWRRLSWDHNIHLVDRVLVKYRRHGRNMTADLDAVLQAQALVFGKMLGDTPAKLRHMFQAAKQEYFTSVKTLMRAQGISPRATASERVAGHVAELIDALARVADKLSLGLLGEAADRLRRRRTRERAA